MIGLPYRLHRPVATGLILAFFLPVFGSMMLAQGTGSVGSPRAQAAVPEAPRAVQLFRYEPAGHVMLGRVVVVGQLQEFAFCHLCGLCQKQGFEQ